MSMMKKGVESFKGQVVEAGHEELRYSGYSIFGTYGMVLNADGTYTKHVVSGEGESITVDATADQIQAYKDKVDADKKARMEAYQAEQVRIEAVTVRKGKKVRVISGRKVAKGTEGIVFWMKEMVFSPRFKNGYNKGADAVQIGIALYDTKNARGGFANVAWTYLNNVEVVL